MIDISSTMERISECLEAEEHLSVWEFDFLESIAEQLGKYKKLSDSQLKILDLIENTILERD